MHIDVAEALAMELLPLDIGKRLVGFSNHRYWKLLEQSQNQRTIGQGTARDLADDKRMHHDTAALQQVGKGGFAPTKMVDPHRRVDEDQLLLRWRRRGAALRSGWLPPNLARRLALSRSISALRPSCSKAERSSGPVSFAALANRSSSRFTVVRIWATLFPFPEAPILASSDASVASMERLSVELLVTACLGGVRPLPASAGRIRTPAAGSNASTASDKGQGI